MTEGRVGFLYRIASNLPQNNETIKLLRSYYLMRCNELTKGYGLPTQHFSTKIRCPRCCIEWTRDAEVKDGNIIKNVSHLPHCVANSAKNIWVEELQLCKDKVCTTEEPIPKLYELAQGSLKTKDI